MRAPGSAPNRQPSATGAPVADGRFWHRIKPNETSRQPRRHIFLDTESHVDPVPGGHEQRWAVAVACFRTARPDRPVRETWETFDDPEVLWKTVSEWCGASGRVVLWAHNLGYDTRISEMFAILPGLGWVLTSHNLTPRGMWLVWNRGRVTICMVDSASVFPTTLAAIGKTVRLGKRELPESGAGGVGLYSRCWQDVEILRTAVTQYLTWLESEDLGNWQMTGAGQAWATYRHRFLDRRLLVHDDTEALTAERRAMWTGRCEAYWHGELDRQVVHEWDFTLAYGRIARSTAVPVRILGPMPQGFDWISALDAPSTALLAEVDISTRVPVVPTVDDGRILWPIGRFSTTLWDVEIREALKAGAKVTVRRAWLYRKAPALAKWAAWVIALVESQSGDDGDWRYIVGKHWQRALVGRLAMTYTQWTDFAESPTPAAVAHPVVDLDTGETYSVVHIGHQMWRSEGQREWDHSMPMVTGYVQATCRAWLWQLLSAMPTQSALYCDTDSVLVTDRHLFALQAIADANPHWGMRLKRSWQGFAVWGPRQIRTGPLVRVSGLPRRATRTGAHTYDGEIWESLGGALSSGAVAKVRTRDRRWTIRGVDHRRDGPPIGWTRPIELGRGRDDDTETQA